MIWVFRRFQAFWRRWIHVVCDDILVWPWPLQINFFFNFTILAKIHVLWAILIFFIRVHVVHAEDHLFSIKLLLVIITAFSNVFFFLADEFEECLVITILMIMLLRNFLSFLKLIRISSIGFFILNNLNVVSETCKLLLLHFHSSFGSFSAPVEVRNVYHLLLSLLALAEK